MGAVKIAHQQLSSSIVSEEALVHEISKLVCAVTGVQLGEKQRHMVSSRFHKHMMDLKIATPALYVNHFNQNPETETQALISLLTTHHTYFFREFPHFEFLRDQGLKNLVQVAKARGQTKLKFWSAACSRGHEVYSLAMFLEAHLPKIDASMSYEIVGTDVDAQSVSVASNGVYSRKELSSIPANYLGNHWARGTGEISEFAKVKSSLKSHCQFKTANLFDLSSYPSAPAYDVIFCRNVFIYFNLPQVGEITARFLKALQPNGLLFIGISESLNGVNVPVQRMGTSIYSHAQPATAVPAKKVTEISKTFAPAPKAKPLRVLCVDDSPTVHSLFKQILKPEFGFEIVGNAENGLEASKFLKTNSVDVMTLDIHMPEQTGLEYLEKNFKSGHPAVVMVSSVSQDNADLAIKALQLGASDYVEKPALNQLSQQAEQIRTKLQCAYLSREGQSKGVSNLSKQFQAQVKIKSPDQTFRLALASPGDRTKLSFLIRELNGDQPPTVIMIDGMEMVLPALAADLSGLTGRTVSVLTNTLQLKNNQIYLADFSKTYPGLKSQFGKRRSSILVYGRPSKTTLVGLKTWGEAQILIEDLGEKGHASDIQASDVVPGTSFGYMSSEYLGSKNG